MSQQLAARCESTPVHKSSFDAIGDGSLVETVIDALAAAEGVSPIDLPPLYGSIDPDALNRLFEHRRSSNSRTRLRFTHCGWNVSVRGDGTIRIFDSDGKTDPRSSFETEE